MSPPVTISSLTSYHVKYAGSSQHCSTIFNSSCIGSWWTYKFGNLTLKCLKVCKTFCKLFQAQHGVKLRLEKLLCFCNPKFCTIHTCNVKFKSRQVANLNWAATINRNLTYLNYNVKMYYQFSNNEYRPILMDVTVDHCGDEPGSASSTFLKLLKTMWLNKSNIWFDQCPIPLGEYYIRDWNFSAADLPSVIPAGRYLVKGIFRAQFDEVLGSTSLYFNVDNHGILDLNMGWVIK